MKEKVFIFGASGFLGRAFLSELPSEWDVISVGRNNEDLFFDLNSSEPEKLKNIVSKGDFWIFLAAISSPDECENNAKFAYQLNVIKTKKLIKWLTNIGVKVIFASSDAVFGNKIEKAYDDDETCPTGEYAKHKATIENFISNNSLVKVMRLSYVLSLDDNFSKLLNEHEKYKKKLNVFLGFKRHIVLLDDVIFGLINLIKRWNHLNFKKINFCGHVLVDRCEMVGILRERHYKELEYICVEAPNAFWVGRSKVINLDCSNFKKLLGRLPKQINQI